MSRPKSWAALAAALSIALLTSLAGPPAAQADRCNPDEMIGQVTGQPYEPVFGHDDGPFCYVMRDVVYPAIGCDPVYQSLVECLQTRPTRAIQVAANVCNETFQEFEEVYTSLPYTVQRRLDPVLDMIYLGC